MGLLKRIATKNGDKFLVKTDEGSFTMCYDGDYNLLFTCNTSLDSKSYTIKPVDEVYPFFDDLYDAISNGAPYINFDGDFPGKDKYFPNESVFEDDEILWYSDSLNGNILVISKGEDYVVTFKKGYISDSKTEVVVGGTFSNCMPYNFTFINMFESIKNHWHDRGYTFSNKVRRR